MINAMPDHVDLVQPAQPPGRGSRSAFGDEPKAMCQSPNQRALRLAPNCTLWARPATEGG